MGCFIKLKYVIVKVSTTAKVTSKTAPEPNVAATLEHGCDALQDKSCTERQTGKEGDD
jgi:hypothetical protein